MLTRRQRRGIRPQQKTNKDKALAAGLRLTMNAMNDDMVVAVAALHDEFGFGEERIKRFLERRALILESCFQEDMLDLKSIETELAKEGVTCFEFYKYDVLIQK